MKLTTMVVLAVSSIVMASCNNQRQDETSDTAEPNPTVQTDKSPDTGTGGPAPSTPKDGDEQKIQSPSN